LCAGVRFRLFPIPKGLAVSQIAGDLKELPRHDLKIDYGPS
jgi:hypothetical protein